MQWLLMLATAAFSCSLFATPPCEVPSYLYNEYTFDGKIPVQSWYFDNSYPPSEPLRYTTQRINELIAKANRREWNYYGYTDLWLFAALDKYRSYFEGKSVGIIGSDNPWYESITLAWGGKPITVEYNTIVAEDPRVKAMTVAEYEKNPIKFDVILSISSIEHDGLGRYGDPLNPTGDLRAMKKTKEMLNDGGILFLAVPVGPDCLVWNAHRIYGKIRLPLLLEGWNVIDSFGFSENMFQKQLGDHGYQPVFVLIPEEKGEL